MNTLIVATDFSATARNAANYATDMAKAIQAEVFLLHVYQVPVTYGDMAFPINFDEWQQDAEAVMKTWKNELEQRTGGQITVRSEVRMGGFFTELETLCNQVHPYAVVMGSKGSSAAERFLLGSHAIFTMRNLPWPAITVPPGASFTSIRKIGLACDLSKPEINVPPGRLPGW